MRRYLTISLLLGNTLLLSQKSDYIWMLGYGGGSQSGPNDEFGNVLIDFRNPAGPDFLEKQQYDMDFYNTNSIISDSAGNLLFYTNGEKIYNKLHVLMENGNGIMSGNGHGYRIPQGSLALPYPEHDRQYIMFSEEYQYAAGTVIGWKLFYHLIDMTQNGGLGKVTAKRVLFLQDTLAWGKITAVNISAPTTIICILPPR